MHNLGDDRELDRLSREAAGRYTPPGAPDWNALSAELDQVMPVDEKKRRPVVFWWLLPLLVAGLAAGYWFTRSDKPGEVAKTSQYNSTPVKIGQDAGGKGGAVTTPPETASPVETVVVPPNNAAREKVNDATSTTNSTPSGMNSSAATNRGAQSIVKNNNARTAQRVRMGNTSSPLQKANNGQTEPGAKPLADLSVAPGMPNDTKAAGEMKTSEAKVNEVKNNEAKNSETQAIENNKPGSKEPATENTPTVAEQPAAVTTPAGKKSPTLSPRGKGFSVAVLGGVDESTVKFKYGNDAGFNVGAMVGYHFSDKFSIHTGGIYTQKNYKVAGADFTAPKGSWASYYKLETIEGDCRMWELPLLARFTISRSNKNSVFLSTGLSSYFMTQENYTYEYYNSMGIPVVRSASYNSGDTHVMSILHLSAGFERRVGKTLSMLVEPYAKLPLGGVGFGSIRLSSFGLNFAVQYRQPSKK